MNVQFGAKIVGLTRENFTSKEDTSIDHQGEVDFRMAQAAIASSLIFSDEVTPGYTIQFEKRCPEESDTFDQDYIPVKIFKGEQCLQTFKAPLFHAFTNRPETLEQPFTYGDLKQSIQPQLEAIKAKLPQLPELKKQLRTAEDVVSWINNERQAIGGKVVMPNGPISWETIHPFVALLNQFRKKEINKKTLIAQEKALAESLRQNS